jgi:hypothetical protein
VTLSERVLAMESDTPNVLREVAISSKRLGDVLCRRGDLSEAEARYRESVALRERALALQDSPADWPGWASVALRVAWLAPGPRPNAALLAPFVRLRELGPTPSRPSWRP